MGRGRRRRAAGQVRTPEDPYVVLGVPTTADDATIKRAFRRLARACHPDAHPDDPTAEEQFKRLSIAYRRVATVADRAEWAASTRRTPPSRPGTRPHAGTYRTAEPRRAAEAAARARAEMDDLVFEMTGRRPHRGGSDDPARDRAEAEASGRYTTTDSFSAIFSDALAGVKSRVEAVVEEPEDALARLRREMLDRVHRLDV